MTVGGRYTLRAAIGNGGMGTVWQATDTLLRREVAVKEVAPPPGVSTTDRDAMYQRMMREARAAAMISHPSVVQVYDVVTDGGRPWIVMELLDARSLADIVVEDGPLAPRVVAKIGMAILGALEMAHAAGVLHRDVKPANVLICTDGRPVLTDFGVARMPSDQQLTTPGMVLGSPHFISPERAMGRPFGPASDLFSLGVTLYAAIEGRPPFDRGDPIATMHSVVEDPPRPPERAGVLAEVLYSLLEKDPDRRWDAATARQALRNLLNGPLASATPHFPTDPYSVVPTQRVPVSPPPTTGGIGGRALLPPDAGVGGRALPPPEPALLQQTNPYASIDPYQQTADPYAAPAAYSASAGAPGGRGSQSPAGPRSDPAAASRRARRRAEAEAAAAAASPLAQASAAFARTTTGVREIVGRLPRNAQLAAAAGLVLVVVLGAALIFRGGGDESGLGTDPDPGGQPTEAPAEVAFEVEEFSGPGFTVNLPAAWEQTDSSDIRVDFGDPEASRDRRLRLLFEPSGTDAASFVTNIAEPSIAENCPEPYARVSLTDTVLAGEPATQLEYTCGDGDDARQALWITAVRDGTAYSFFVTMPPDDFEETRAIFDEMVSSFQFA